MNIDPADDVNGSKSISVNDEEQHSLWPVFVNVAVGSRVIYGKAPRVASRSASSAPRHIWPRSRRERLVGGPSS